MPDLTSRPPEPRPASAALYLGAGLAQIMGLLAVRFEVSEPGLPFFLIILTIAGLYTSYFLRRRGMSTKYIPLGAAGCFLLFFLIAGGGGSTFEALPMEAMGGTQLSILYALALTATLTNFLAVTDDAVLFTSIWVIAIIGLAGSQDLNREVVFCFLGFLLCASFLLVHQNYLQQTRSSGRKLAIPTSLLKIQGLTAAAAWLAAVVLGAALAIPFRMLGKGLSLKQVMDQFSLPPSAIGSPRLSRRLRNGLAFDNRDEFRVGIGPIGDDTTPVFSVEAPGPRFWRGRTYALYSGSAWQNDGRQGGRIEAQTGVVPGEFDYVVASRRDLPRSRIRRETHRFRPDVSMIGSLYHAAEPKLVHNIPDGVFRRYDGTLGASVIGGQRYSIESEVSEATPEELDVSSTDYPKEIKDSYLTIARQNPVLRQLAQEAIGTRKTPYAKAEAIREFVGNRTMYNLSAPAVPLGADAVEFFLNQSHEGYCDLYATATTMLCRYAGVPARLATGFNAGTPDPTKPGRYLLTQNNRHAWTEVYFVGYGWIPFDATASSTSATEAPEPTTPQKRVTFQDRLLAALPTILIGLGAIGVAFVAVNELRRNPIELPKRTRTVVPREISNVLKDYTAATRKAGRLGARRLPSMTAREHLALVESKLGREVADALRPLANLADDALFAPNAVTSDDARNGPKTPSSVSAIGFPTQEVSCPHPVSPPPSPPSAPKVRRESFCLPARNPQKSSPRRNAG